MLTDELLAKSGRTDGANNVPMLQRKLVNVAKRHLLDPTAHTLEFVGCQLFDKDLSVLTETLTPTSV
jgi:hypothetical protein